MHYLQHFFVDLFGKMSQEILWNLFCTLYLICDDTTTDAKVRKMWSSRQAHQFFWGLYFGMSINLYFWHFERWIETSINSLVFWIRDRNNVWLFYGEFLIKKGVIFCLFTSLLLFVKEFLHWYLINTNRKVMNVMNYILWPKSLQKI